MLKINDIYIENRLIASPSKPDREFLFPGKDICPGFCDSHTHFIQFALKKNRLNLSKIESKKELYERLSEWIRVKEREEVTIAEDWDESNWEDEEFPTKKELNKISSKKPIILRRVCGHIAIANDPGLSRIPPTYTIVNHRTGILKEEVVLKINEIFPPSKEGMQEVTLLAQSEIIKLGITSIHDIVIPEHFNLYQALEDKGKLKLSIYGFITENYIDKMKNLKSSYRVKLAGIKIFTDGSIGARTAALKDFHYTQKGNGLLLKNKEELEELIQFANNKGYQLAIHAIGDLAIQMILDAMDKNPIDNPGRHRIEHFELATDEQIREAIEKNIILSMQPNFLKWSKPGGLYEKALGKNYKDNNRICFIMREGGMVTFGSDGMPYGPLFGIKQVTEAPFTPQRIEKMDAIRAYTQGGAYASFKEGEVGSIEEGMKADLVIIDKQGIYMTIIDGEIEYCREGENKITS